MTFDLTNDLANNTKCVLAVGVWLYPFLLRVLSILTWHPLRWNARKWKKDWAIVRLKFNCFASLSVSAWTVGNDWWLEVMRCVTEICDNTKTDRRENLIINKGEDIEHNLWVIHWWNHKKKSVVTMSTVKFHQGSNDLVSAANEMTPKTKWVTLREKKRGRGKILLL